MSIDCTIAGVACTVIVSLAIGGCCKLPKKSSDSDNSSSTSDDDTMKGAQKGTHFHFNRVPVEVDIPAGWKETQNTKNWAVFRPNGGGALAAFSAGADCGAVEKRFYGALQELGLTNVVWSGGQKQSAVNGLRTVSAEGTAIETSQLSYVKYALTHASNSRGCLVSIVNIWKNKTGDYREAGDKMFDSISAQ